MRLTSPSYKLHDSPVSIIMGVFEYDFCAKNCDVARGMKVGRVSHTVLPTLLPHLILKADMLQGDGGVGTIRAISVNPAATGGEEKTITQHTTVFDEGAGTIVWEEADERFSKPVVHTLTMKQDGADLQLHWTLQFEPVDPATPPPEDMRMISVELFNALKAHVEANPTWP